MINYFKRLSIKWKLFTILIFSSALSLLVAMILLFVVEMSDMKNKVRTELTAIAGLIANRSTAALSFDDVQVGRENLEPLKELEHVKAACLYDASGQLFVSLEDQSQANPPCASSYQPINSHYERLNLFIAKDIVLDDENIGTVYIVANIAALMFHKIQYLGLVIVVLFVAFVITFFLTVPILNVVSKPIIRLAKTAAKISQKKDLTLRAVKYSHDELGVLVDSFNDMVGTVEHQNKALTNVKNNYLALYDNNPTMIFYLDLEGTVLSANRFGAKQLDLLPEQLQGHSIYDHVHPDDVNATKALFDLCQLNPHKVYKQEIRKVCRDGRVIWVRESARLLVNDQAQANVLLVCEDVTENKRLNEKIAYQASHDALTGLVNRREFDGYVQRAVINAQNNQVEHALCYLDLDQFKVVNDTCGHLAGDELLRQLGDELRASIRHNDILARLGGDEFGVLMYECSLPQSVNICEKLRNVIADFQFGWEDRSFNVGVSIGVAQISATSGNAVELLKEADAACYIAKEKGRNRVHVFSPDDEEMASRQGEMQWVEKIQRGIDENRFCLYGQLIVPIDEADEGIHFETLIRYQDENGNTIPPGAFLPAAERYNLAAALDSWVIEHLFSWLHANPEFLAKLEICSINLSGLSLSDENMLDFIDRQFNQWLIPRQKVCFEITETAAISNLGNARVFVDKLRKQGCLFSLDDFGSGLSSFAYLKSLPVDFLKIDGLFVKDILEDEVDRAMVASINSVGHVMGKKTIAEFVENEQILAQLHQLGVNYAQGYGIAKPVPLEEL